MATYKYTGALTDLGENTIPEDAAPELVVVAGDGFGPSGFVVGALREVPVLLKSDGRNFEVDLIASTDLVPPSVYTLKCTWFTAALKGQKVPAGWAEVRFTAEPGGGRIIDMVNAPISTWIAGPPWPDPPRPGQYWDITNDDVWNVTADDIRKVTV